MTPSYAYNPCTGSLGGGTEGAMLHPHLGQGSLWAAVVPSLVITALPLGLASVHYLSPGKLVTKIKPQIQWIKDL